MHITVPPGVFRPISDSRLLADAGRDHVRPGMRVLDLCTGSGIIAISAARRGAIVDAVDVSGEAIAAVEANARRSGVTVRTHVGDLFGPFAGRRFDLITANPPYVPHHAPDPPRTGPSRAWAAGPDGRIVLDRICDQASRYLRPGGTLLLVHSSLIGEAPTVDRLIAAGLTDVDVIACQRGPLGPLMRAQRDAGRIPADVATEDLIVIRGRTE